VTATVKRLSRSNRYSENQTHACPLFHLSLSIEQDCRFCGGPDEDPPAFLQTAGSNKHAKFENAMKDILDTSSCAAFKKLTSVSILDKATKEKNIAEVTASTFGEVTIELDHIFVGELSDMCQEVITSSFVSAMNKVFHTSDQMQLGIISTDKKRKGMRLGDWSYNYNVRTFWVSDEFFEDRNTPS
jgi:hypothetical protein